MYTPYLVYYFPDCGEHFASSANINYHNSVVTFEEIAIYFMVLRVANTIREERKMTTITNAL